MVWDIHRPQDDKVVKKIHKWKPVTSRALGKPKITQKDAIIKYINNILISIFQDWPNWTKFNEKAKAFNKVVVPTKKQYEGILLLDYKIPRHKL